MKSALGNLAEEEELVDKILTFLLKLNFTPENYDHSSLPLVIRQYKEWKLS